MYWVLREVNYYHAAYSDNIFCTFDYALADLLSRRVNTAPRIGKGFINEEFIDADGTISEFKLKRLEDSKLEKDIADMLVDFHSYLLLQKTNSLKFGTNKLRDYVMAKELGL